jgi:tetratricopeptide (TPR) repeat protein
MLRLPWFRRPKAGSDSGDLQQQLANIERDARSARDEGLARLMNQAGDLCAQAGLPTGAMSYYGRAIDAYLATGFSAQAAAMCNKLIRYSPTVVRAHCTLAFLALADDQVGDASKEIAAYVAAARRTSTEKLAAPRLRMMARITELEEIKRQIAAHLEELGDGLGARRILSALGEDPEAAPPVPLEQDDFWEEDEQWDRLVHAAVMQTDELWKQL